MKKHLIIAAVFCSTFAFTSSQASWWNKFIPGSSSAKQTVKQKKDSKYPSLTTDQVNDIKKLIPSYLIANPEVLVKVSQALQQKAAAEEQGKAKKAIESNSQALFHNPNSPTAGNPKGTVTLVEFFDYQCGHCKKAAKIVEQLVSKNPQLRIVYKEMPIFGATSTLASKAALAAFKLGKYKAYHDALFKTPGGINQEAIDTINKALSISTSMLSSTQNTQIDAELSQNQQLAQELKLRGTPAFIVTNQNNTESVFIPGAVPMATLQAAITKLTPHKTSISTTTPQNTGAQGGKPSAATPPSSSPASSTSSKGAQTSTGGAQTSTGGAQTSTGGAQTTTKATKQPAAGGSDATKPADSSGSDATKPTDSSDADATKPASSGDADATKPTDSSDTDATKPASSGDTDATKPAASGDTDATKPASSGDADAAKKPADSSGSDAAKKPATN